MEFDIIKTDCLKNLIKRLRPANVSPTSEELAFVLLDEAFNKLVKANENHNKSTGVLFLLLKKHENANNLWGILRDINGKTTFLNCFKISNERKLQNPFVERLHG